MVAVGGAESDCLAAWLVQRRGEGLVEGGRGRGVPASCTYLRRCAQKWRSCRQRGWCSMAPSCWRCLPLQSRRGDEDGEMGGGTGGCRWVSTAGAPRGGPGLS